MAYASAADIISDAAIDLGLVTSPIADPYGSTDPNILQLCSLLTRSGRALVRAHPWQYLQVLTAGFSTVSSQPDYALPTPFNRIVDGSMWNRTQQQPVFGPLNAQQWQEAKARSSDVAQQYFRIAGDFFYIHPTPSAIESIAYEYISGWWVDTDGTSSPNADAPDNKDATIFFDADLVVADLKLRFLRAKGFDSTAAQQDFDTHFSRVTGQDGAAPVIDLAGRGGFRYLDGGNLPDTGYGD